MKRTTPGERDSRGEREWLRVFFGLSACSWMPHWSCHYYRLETGSSFVVGSWQFSQVDSVLSLVVYTALIVWNLGAIILPGARLSAALTSGVLHIAIGILHAYRIVRPFTFEIFGHAWSIPASIREALVVSAFGGVSVWLAVRLKRDRYSERAGERER